MAYISTEGRTPETSLPEAISRGLAPDGGLFMPASLPTLSREDLTALRNTDWPGTASFLARRFLAEAMEPAAIDTLARQAFDFPLPLTPLGERIHLLDLSRGPTLAFKDVGARFMARLTAHFRKGVDEPLTVLTATSGDTGGAVAHAFLGLPGLRVVVLFPDGKVSPSQERQFSTLGGNVQAVAVQGDFDDCQRMVKDVFRDTRMREAVALTSANSINIGRFLPQSFYYFFAWASLSSRVQGDLPGGGAPGLGNQASGKGAASFLFSVPSGNFGNLAAGLMAKSMGLPEVGFLAATNANDGVPEYLRTGRFQPRPSRRTLSTAMDVGNPSNLARILHLYAGDLPRLRQDLTGRAITDEATRVTIRQVWERTGQALDPHTAVGFAALEAELEARPGALGILLGTASAAKFAEVVEPILGEALPLPPELARGMERGRSVTPMEPDAGALREFLLLPLSGQ